MEGQGCCKEKPANSCSTGNSGAAEKTGSCGDKAGGCGNGNCSGGCGGGCGGKSKCCPVTVIKGAFIGGIIMFVWFYLSWTVFPWHTTAAPNMHVEPQVLGEYFVFCLFVSALLTKLLKKRAKGCCPVAGSIIIGLLVAAFNYVPNIIWLPAPLHDSLVGIADDVIAITLAGAAIGKFALQAGACMAGKGDAGKEAGDCGDKKTSCH